MADIDTASLQLSAPILRKGLPTNDAVVAQNWIGILQITHLDVTKYFL
jgi:hypothetical protein